jgi:hypothetical protein
VLRSEDSGEEGQVLLACWLACWHCMQMSQPTWTGGSLLLPHLHLLVGQHVRGLPTGGYELQGDFRATRCTQQLRIGVALVEVVVHRASLQRVVRAEIAVASRTPRAPAEALGIARSATTNLPGAALASIWLRGIHLHGRVACSPALVREPEAAPCHISPLLLLLSHQPQRCIGECVQREGSLAPSVRAREQRCRKWPREDLDAPRDVGLPRLRCKAALGERPGRERAARPECKRPRSLTSSISCGTARSSAGSSSAAPTAMAMAAR